MERPDPLATMRAVVETIIPGPPHDPTPGAADVGAHEFVTEMLQRLGDEILGGAVMVLEGFAQQAGANSFVDLDLPSREQVLRSIADSGDDLGQLVRLLFAMTMAAYYGEMTSLEDGQLVRRPVSWDLIGFPGPAVAYPGRAR